MTIHINVLPPLKPSHELGGAQTETIQIPAGCKKMTAWIQGAGGAGDAYRNGVPGGGGGRGGLMKVVIWGNLGGKILNLVTGVRGYDATPTSPGNIGTASSVTFDNGWSHIAGGGQRAIGALGGAGGNSAEIGTSPSYISDISHTNLGSEIGQNSTATQAGSGAGQGDTGGGGNGGDANSPIGAPAIDGWINIDFDY